MHASEEPYYKINRIILKILGLWPYQQSRLVRMQNVLLIVILTSFIIVQLLVLVTTQYNTNILFRVLSFTLPSIFVTIKYCLFVVQTNSVKHLLDKIHEDWNSLRDKMEIEIIKKYACQGRFFTITMMSFCYFGITICGMFQLLPIILDIVSPLNESRPNQLVVRTQYFVNEKKYFYTILTHEIIVGCVGATAMCITIATLVMYTHHICALLKIASHRIENAIKKNTLAVPGPRRDSLFYQRKIVHAVIIHQRAIKFIEYLMSKIITSYTVLIIVGVSSLSFSLFQFLQLVTLMDNTSEIFIFAILVITHLGYMFIANYGGQEITEHGIELFKTTYNVPWYTLPLRTQKLLLFIMQKGTRNITLTCGGLFVASLECFASVKYKLLAQRIEF
ncbi:odorant receptor 9a-like [Odontomachus brunneus]|uniref:odorant receptor 9a-like n=1 Tax=Odontomachus brunneus TaxID=486640 RepID=UPI0013F1DA56|nr:odorant receptor 9a-like [Odontomachus brunneus]